jgi:hypothetical protein
LAPRRINVPASIFVTRPAPVPITLLTSVVPPPRNSSEYPSPEMAVADST